MHDAFSEVDQCGEKTLEILGTSEIIEHCSSICKVKKEASWNKGGGLSSRERNGVDAKPGLVPTRDLVPSPL